MNTLLRIASALCLAAWFGAMLFFSLGVAPVAFAVFPDHVLAGNMVNASIARLHELGYGACGLLVLTQLMRALLAHGRVAWLKAALATGMLALTLGSGLVVTPPMAEIRAHLGAIDALPPSNPERQRFDWLHQLSVAMMSANLLIAAAVLVLEQLPERKRA